MKTCFFITPIGDPGSSDRKRSDKLLNSILIPVCSRHDIKVIRSDKILTPSLLINEILGYLFDADIVITDFSKNNPNVMYETAIRHFVVKPIFYLAQTGQSLPFDVHGYTTIFINHTDKNSLENAGNMLDKMLENHTPETKIINPVTLYANAKNLIINIEKTQSKEDLLHEVKSMLTKITDTLENNKPLLVDKKQIKDIKKTLNWTGKWISNLGDIELEKNKNRITGKYQYFSRDYVGSLEGNIVNNHIIYKWKWIDGTFSGFGFWHIGDENHTGCWYYDNGSYSYEELLNSIKKGEKINIQENHRWVIYGKYES